MEISKKTLKKYGVKVIDKWSPPEGEDLRPLVAMPNIPRPLHTVNPRSLLGASTWNHMRRGCYARANNTCEICGNEPENLRNRHAHEVYEIDYKNGTARFVRVVCLCSLCHLGCIHTGRALTLWKNHNPLCPTQLLLDGAEHAFKIISEYNKDNPGADLRAYSTFLDYLKHDELKPTMEKLIDKYDIKFYTVEEDLVEWKDWKLLIGDREYPTPYASKSEWQAAMDEREEQDTARLLQKQMGDNFSSDIYKELDQIINKKEEHDNVGN